MNTNNTTCLSELAVPRMHTTNAHAPVGDELAAFDSSIFLSANFERLENFWLCFPKCIFTDAKVLLFPQTPKYFSILFSNRQYSIY